MVHFVLGFVLACAACLQGPGEALETPLLRDHVQLTFDRDAPVQLLRITLPGDSALYPVVSGSQHRCTIRFLSWTGVATRPVQRPDDVPFVLTCCS